MHLLFGLFFLVLSMALLLLYLVAMFMLPIGLQWLQVKQSQNHFVLSRARVKKLLYSCLAVTLIFHVSIYASQHLKWCGEDNANLQAKEYFVAGQPLAGLRLVLTTFINPDNPIWRE